MSLQRKLVVGACVVVLGCGGRERPALDAGAGRDAAAIDASTPVDAGPGADGGVTLDAGPYDAGGPLDSGLRDAGPRDAGSMDGGSVTDAGAPDASALDAGPRPDAGPCVAPPATGAPLVLDGTLSASTTWNRPDDDSECPSSTLETLELYALSTYVICGDGGTFRVRLDGVDEDAALTLEDPYLVAYAGSAIPADALQCLAINDDAATTKTLGSEIPSVTVPAGSDLTIAVTTYTPAADAGTGTFRLTITRL